MPISASAPARWRDFQSKTYHDMIIPPKEEKLFAQSGGKHYGSRAEIWAASLSLTQTWWLERVPSSGSPQERANPLANPPKPLCIRSEFQRSREPGRQARSGPAVRSSRMSAPTASTALQLLPFAKKRGAFQTTFSQIVFQNISVFLRNSFEYCETVI